VALQAGCADEERWEELFRIGLVICPPSVGGSAYLVFSVPLRGN
jgi:hypothetical protein